MNIPDVRNRIIIAIPGGCVAQVNLLYDNQGNPILPGQVELMLTESNVVMQTEAAADMETE